MPIARAHLYQFTTPLTVADRWQRRGWLGLLLAPIAGAILLSQGVHLPLPGCPLMHQVGIPCPGWGLTRSFTAIARGDIQQALHYNGFGLVFFMGCLIAIAHQLLELGRDRQLWTLYLPWWRQERVKLGIVGLWFVYHGLRLQVLWRSGELLHSMQQSVWGDWLLSAIATTFS